jgi:hypothetical protein
VRVFRNNRPIPSRDTDLIALSFLAVLGYRLAQRFKQLETVPRTASLRPDEPLACCAQW